MESSDDARMDEVYIALSALSIVGGTVTGLVGYIGTSVTLGTVAGGPDVRLKGWIFLLLGAALFAAGTGYLAFRSVSRFRRSRRPPDAGEGE